MAILQDVKAKSFDKKDLLTTDEFKAVVAGVMQKARTLSRFVVSRW